MRSVRSGRRRARRALHDVYVLASSCDVNWIVVDQAAQALRDEALGTTVESCSAQTAQHLRWLKSRMKTAAPPALVVA